MVEFPGKSEPCIDQMETDVCVIGAGPAGLTLASDLASSGIRVVVVERGSSTPAKPKTPVEIARGLPYPLDETIGSGAGGTAGLWGVETPDGNDRVRFRQLDQIDVDGRPSVGLAPWPLPFAELSDWYPEARRTVGLPASPPSLTDDPVEQITGGNVVPAVFEFPSKNTFTRSLPELLAASDRVELLFDHHVTGLIGHGDPLEVHHVVLRPTAGGDAIVVRPRWLVAAGGAVENVALLGLLTEAEAGPRRMPEALGRGFMEHFHFNGGLLVPSSPRMLQQPAIQGFQRTADRPIERRYTLSPALEDQHRLLRTTVKLVRVRRSRHLDVAAMGDTRTAGAAALRASRTALREHDATGVLRQLHPALLDVPGIGRLIRGYASHAVARLLNKREAFLLVTVAEQRRRASSRVVMDRSGTKPAPRVDLVPDEEDLSQLYRSLKAFDAAFHASRIGRVYPLFSDGQAPGNLGWGHHHMGTTAMSKDITGGVVGVDLRIHGSTNAYALGSSVFPSGGHANPTLTIMALAHRLAEHLRTSAREIAT